LPNDAHLADAGAPGVAAIRFEGRVVPVVRAAFREKGRCASPLYKFRANEVEAARVAVCAAAMPTT
jgi:hypothetical protein